jgi:hypothetical protein
MIDLFWQEHSIGLSYQAQRGVSIFLMVDQGRSGLVFHPGGMMAVHYVLNVSTSS